MKGFDEESLVTLRNDLEELDGLAESLEPENFPNAEIRLEKVVYVLESVAEVGGSLATDDVEGIIVRVGKLQETLLKQVDTKKYPGYVAETLYREVGRLGEINSILANYVYE